MVYTLAIIDLGASYDLPFLFKDYQFVWSLIGYKLPDHKSRIIFNFTLLTHSDNGETECFFKATIFTIKFLIYKSIVNHLSTYQIC